MVADENHDIRDDDDFFREVVVVADCRGSSSRQALVPHLVLFSSCQGHDGHDDDNVNLMVVMTITMRMMVMTKKVGRMKPMMSKTMMMIIHDKH